MALTKLLKIFSGGAMRPLLREIIPLFERVHAVTAEVVIIYAAGLSSHAADAATGRTFLGFMRSEQAKQLMCANGLDPA
jgi:hypothetical protein